MLIVRFTDFPTISTPRLHLRQVRETDVEALFELRSRDEVIKYLDRHKPHDTNEVLALVQKMDSDFKQSEGISWIITSKENDTAIGTIGYWRMDKPNHRAEIGYMLHPDYWGKGLTTEAMYGVLDYAFNTMRFHSVEANVNPLNEASKKLLLKAGFVQEAYFRENYYFNGIFLDSIIYSLLHYQFGKR